MRAGWQPCDTAPMTPDAFQAAVIAAITTGILAAVVTQSGALIAGWLARRHEDRHRFTDHKRERFALLRREADEHVRVVQAPA